MELALLARNHPYQVRFIELMPTVSTGRWRRHFLPMEEVRRCLAGLGPLEAVRHQATNGPAQIFRLPGFRGELGFITPMSSHHCQTCNRLRLTAAGALRPLSLIHISEPTSLGMISYAVFCLKKKN